MTLSEAIQIMTSEIVAVLLIVPVLSLNRSCCQS